MAHRRAAADFAAKPGAKPGADPAAERSTDRDTAPERTERMSPAEIATFFETLAAQRPEPRTELHFTNPFTMVVAVVLSAQSTDVGVNKATRRLFEVADSPEAMLALGEEGLKRYISSIGLYNSKARHVIALSRQLIDRHGGEVPRDRAALMALPGVGRKTANVILNSAFGEPTIAVDTHVFRVSNRTGLAPGRTVRAVEDRLQERVPERFKTHAHHWLILHGRYICKARRPDCARCPVHVPCKWPHKAGTVGKETHS